MFVSKNEVSPLWSLRYLSNTVVTRNKWKKKKRKKEKKERKKKEKKKYRLKLLPLMKNSSVNYTDERDR